VITNRSCIASVGHPATFDLSADSAIIGAAKTPRPCRTVTSKVVTSASKEGMERLLNTLHGRPGDDADGITGHRDPIEPSQIDGAAERVHVGERDQVRRGVQRAVPDRRDPRRPDIVVGVGAHDQHPVAPVGDAVVVDLALPYHSAPASRWPILCSASHAAMASASPAVRSNCWYRRAASMMMELRMDRVIHADMVMPAVRAWARAIASTNGSREIVTVAAPMTVTVVSRATGAPGRYRTHGRRPGPLAGSSTDDGPTHPPKDHTPSPDVHAGLPL